eukprot:Skav236456  [mRNA]  locus=scaffold1758:325778:327439:+ [translate_table: standard]
MPDRMHTNPHLATHLIGSHVQDPEHYIIANSIRAVRRLLFAMSASDRSRFLHLAASHTLKPHRVYGPAGAFAMNLARIGWSVDRYGTLRTDTKIEFHLLHSCWHQIRKYLDYTWSKHMVQMLLQRPRWRHMPPPNPKATLAIMTKFSPEEQHMIAREILGVYHGTPQKKHYTPEQTACPFCGCSEDDLQHRLLHCPATDAVRAGFPQLIQRWIDGDDCSMLFPVITFPPMYEFQQWIFQHQPMPAWNDDVVEIMLQHVSNGERLLIWTDGSCQHPTYEHSRRASFAAVFHPEVDEQEQQQMVLSYKTTRRVPPTFLTLFVAAVQGPQTTPRAELQAVLHVMSMFADLHSTVIFPTNSILIHTDSAYVMSLSEKVPQVVHYEDLEDLPNYDCIRFFWKCIRLKIFAFRKVKSHVARDAPDQLKFEHLGNEAADHAAGIISRSPDPWQLELPSPEDIEENTQPHMHTSISLLSRKCVHTYVKPYRLSRFLHMQMIGKLSNRNCSIGPLEMPGCPPIISHKKHYMRVYGVPQLHAQCCSGSSSCSGNPSQMQYLRK